MLRTILETLLVFTFAAMIFWVLMPFGSALVCKPGALC